MAVVSDTTIARAALAGGFPRDKAAMAVAVALAESGGDATNTNGNTNGTTDYGLWQINSIHKADLAGGNWQDPNSNARMAAAVFRRSNNSFYPWYAWRDGKHLPFMPRATIAVIQADAGGGVAYRPDGDNPLIPNEIEEPADEAAGAWAEIKKAFSTITDGDFWIRAGMMVLGGTILIAAVVALLISMGGRGKLKQGAKVVKSLKSSKASTTGGNSESSAVE